MSTIWKNGKYQPLIRYVTNKDFKLLSNLVNIINGDSNTKGSFRKTIKDLIGGAPEAYDTLKEIADVLKIPLKQVEHCLYRGKESLKKELMKRGMEQ